MNGSETVWSKQRQKALGMILKNMTKVFSGYTDEGSGCKQPPSEDIRDPE
jgi:hypothetical protein